MSVLQTIARALPGGERSDAIPRDEQFNLLSCERRITVVTRVAEDGTTTLPDLAAAIAADENDVSPEDLTTQQRKRVYVALYQHHIPRLADWGAVAYVKDRGIVRPGENLHELYQHLDRA